MDKYFNLLMILVFIVLVISIFLSLFRTIILAIMYKQTWLLDICLVYCLISFLAVVALTKISIVEKDNEE